MDGKEFLFKVYLEAIEAERDSIGIQFLKLIDEYEAKETELVGANPNLNASAGAIVRGIVNYELRTRQFDYALGSEIPSLELEIRGWEIRG